MPSLISSRDVGLLVVDASHDNSPYPSGKGKLLEPRQLAFLDPVGLADMQDKNVIITLSAQPNEISDDRIGSDLSPFAEAMLATLEYPRLPSADLPRAISNEMDRASEGAQIPSVPGGLLKNLFSRAPAVFVLTP